MPTCILHLSDLHVGGAEAADTSLTLTRLIDRLDPRLVIASGDLTHRGKPEQHDRAAAFLRGLGRPLLVVPGNHDIPWLPPARVTRTFAEFERLWETTEPVHSGDGLYAVGLNSVRAWRHQSGGIREAQLVRAERLLDEAPAGALRVVALHHHLIGAPWRSRKRPVSRRSHVLARLVDAGAELILAGHIHQAAVSERRDFEVAGPEQRGVVVSIAPGFGRPRPRRLGEARGLQAYSVDDETLDVETYVWSGEDWARTAIRRFPRG